MVTTVLIPAVQNLLLIWLKALGKLMMGNICQMQSSVDFVQAKRQHGIMRFVEAVLPILPILRTR